jgi:hypothetical protein
MGGVMLPLGRCFTTQPVQQCGAIESPLGANLAAGQSAALRDALESAGVDA